MTTPTQNNTNLMRHANEKPFNTFTIVLSIKEVENKKVDSNLSIFAKFDGFTTWISADAILLLRRRSMTFLTFVSCVSG